MSINKDQARSYRDAILSQNRIENSTEHSYRSHLKAFIESHGNKVVATNEPKRVGCGAPDFQVTRGDVPIGYIETKNLEIGVLDSRSTQDQIQRYFSGGLGSNFILTDYLEFRFFREDELYATVNIGSENDSDLNQLVDLIDEFLAFKGITIKSAKRLASVMARKARLIRDVISKALDDPGDRGGELRNQFDVFKRVLIHDLTESGFSDMYSQTIAYGLFAARLHDPTLEDFSRIEAAELLPKSNPFLRNLFSQIGAIDLDTRLRWVVDDLVEVFKYADVRKILHEYGDPTGKNDPVVHFYEDFLAEYDSSLRKSKGVWYTPEPIVDFIVRSVDHVLKENLSMKEGLASQEETTIKIIGQGKTKKQREQYHSVPRVQVLDPATGTGTFLARVIAEIKEGFKGNEAAWKSHGETELLKRIHGFEILMAPYAVAHLKIGHVLSEYKIEPKSRVGIYLTNSLEEEHPDTGTLFAQWLSQESQHANEIKRDMPIMCVVGNPPYNSMSTSMGDWIVSLIEEYKYVADKHFGERKHWLHDDYVKFIRLAQHYIERTGKGVVGYITNNAYLRNPTFRGMRYQLLKAFDEIYILDLHGGTKEQPPSEVVDENVFDIQQGVSIFIGVKTTRQKKLGKIRYFEFWGKRNEKYKSLESSSIGSVPWESVKPSEPYYFFSPSNFADADEYNKGLDMRELFDVGTMGFASAQDKLTIAFTRTEMLNTVRVFLEEDVSQIKRRFGIKKESRDWQVKSAKEDLERNFGDETLVPVTCRPFDRRYTVYTGTSRGFYASPQRRVMDPLLAGGNFALITCKRNRDSSRTHWVSENIVSKSAISSLDNCYVFPAFKLESSGEDMLGNGENLTTNLRSGAIAKFEDRTGLTFDRGMREHSSPKEAGKIATKDIADYIYGILNTESYLDRYEEHLKVDFPRIPLPKSADQFEIFMKYGRACRRVHLQQVNEPIPDNVLRPVLTGQVREPIGSARYDAESQRVIVSEDAYVEKIKPKIWNMKIGGYQPAQKWLKDRKGRRPSSSEWQDYQALLDSLVRIDQLKANQPTLDLQ